VAYIIEIATADFISTKAAVEGGADRIELCAALTEGGTTPSYGTIRKCREQFDVQLFPILRPRGGDFLYTEEEFDLMKRDCLLMKELGCDGIVSGFLLNNGEIDREKMSKIIDLAYPLEVTFHRAFDRCRDPFQAMEQLINIGCQRILTSGQQPTATEGLTLIKELISRAGDKIIIMPGSGVRKENIRQIAVETGATELHSSLRSKKKSEMEFIHPSFEKSEESYTNPYINPNEVKSLRTALEQ
jgi:copper homeostasis protein